MESELDTFLKVLQKRQRNLGKKLDRIKKKQAEVKASGKEMKEEEKKMIESAPLVEELSMENEKLIQEYRKYLETTQKDQKKPTPKPEDRRIPDIVNLWVLGEFLSNEQTKEKYIKENPAEQDLEAFLLLHSKSRGQTGETLSEILSTMEKSVDLYLNKSDKIAPGTLRTYKKLEEFSARGAKWASNQRVPQAEVKSEGLTHAVNTHSSQNVVEKKSQAEEAKVDVKLESNHKKRVEQEGDQSEKGKIVKNTQEEDEGFVEVKARKPKNSGGQQRDTEERGGRGERGRGGRGNRRYREGPRNN